MCTCIRITVRICLHAYTHTHTPTRTRYNYMHQHTHFVPCKIRHIRTNLDIDVCRLSHLVDKLGIQLILIQRARGHQRRCRGLIRHSNRKVNLDRGGKKFARDPACGHFNHRIDDNILNGRDDSIGNCRLELALGRFGVSNVRTGQESCEFWHEVATMSRLLKIIRLFCRISSVSRALLQKRPIILRSILIVATPQLVCFQTILYFASRSRFCTHSTHRRDQFTHTKER